MVRGSSNAEAETARDPAALLMVPYVSPPGPGDARPARAFMDMDSAQPPPPASGRARQRRGAMQGDPGASTRGRDRGFFSFSSVLHTLLVALTLSQLVLAAAGRGAAPTIPKSRAASANKLNSKYNTLERLPRDDQIRALQRVDPVTCTGTQLEALTREDLGVTRLRYS